MPHSEEIPVPPRPKAEDLLEFSDSEQSEPEGASSSKHDESFEMEASKSEPSLFTQTELNDLVRDLNLTKHQSEVLASRLQEKNMLHKDVRVSKFRSRSDDFVHRFSLENNLSYCNNILGLFMDLNLSYDPTEWRLFIDSSLYSTKAVLLHNGNALPSIPVAHSVVLRENYENLAFILEKIKYEEHKWQICCDLKVVAILSGLQLGFTKYMCFLCKWNSRAKKEHYIRSEWEPGDGTPGSHNVI